MKILYFVGVDGPNTKELIKGVLKVKREKKKEKKATIISKKEIIHLDKILKVELYVNFWNGYYMMVKNNVEEIYIFLPFWAFKAFGKWHFITKGMKTKRIMKKLIKQIQTSTYYMYKD